MRCNSDTAQLAGCAIREERGSGGSASRHKGEDPLVIVLNSSPPATALATIPVKGGFSCVRDGKVHILHQRGERQAHGIRGDSEKYREVASIDRSRLRGKPT